MRKKQLWWALALLQGAKNEKLAFLRMEAPKSLWRSKPLK